MKRKFHILTALILLNGTCKIHAQYENEFTVTSEEGEKAVITVPEAMTYTIDSLLSNYNAQTYLEVDTTCNMRDFNPVFDRETYIDRLKRLPTMMEMPYNEIVHQFIERYSGRLRRSVSFMLGACNFYMPIFEQALEAYGLPLELKYLPVIESSLKPNAVSHAGAAGLWQFMITTGKQYGLEINSLVDERRDPIKASYAAARYLKDLYRIFNDWNLVIAAYNCGPENVNKAIRRAGGPTDYWHIYPYLPKETRGYVPAFIAANYIMNYYCEHNICPMSTTLPTKSDTIMVSRDVHFEQIAYFCGLSIEQIKDLNPQYRRNIINGSTQLSVLRLPTEAINAFLDNEEDLYAYNADSLLSKRMEVTVNNTVPAYTPPRKSGRKSRYSSKSKYRKGKKAVRRSSRSSASSRKNRRRR